MSREAFWKVEVNPCAGGPENKFFVQEYMSLGNGRAAIGQVLYVGTYGDCCSLKDELDAGKLDRDAVWENYLQKQFEGYKATFSIYQLNDSMKDRIYMSLSWIRSKCLLVERRKYEYKCFYDPRLWILFSGKCCRCYPIEVLQLFGTASTDREKCHGQSSCFF